MYSRWRLLRRNRPRDVAARLLRFQLREEAPGHHPALAIYKRKFTRHTSDTLETVGGGIGIDTTKGGLGAGDSSTLFSGIPIPTFLSPVCFCDSIDIGIAINIEAASI